MKKRILSLALVLCMVMTLLPMSAFAADIVDSGTCGANLTWTLDSDGILTIRGTGAMDDYYLSSPAPWYSLRNDIKSVTIENGVKRIGDCAFERCENLTRVEIPDSVTSIGSCAFYNCWNLMNISIPNGVTSIGDLAFECCDRLVSVTIGNGVTNIEEKAFYGCSCLKNINVAADNSCYSSLNGVLFNKEKTLLLCYPAGKADSSYVLPDSVTSIEDYAFYHSQNLTSVIIPEGVTSIGDNVFTFCDSLTSVEIPSSVMSIGETAFLVCVSLTDINVAANNSKFCSLNGVLFNKNKTVIVCFPAGITDESYVVPDSVTSIGDYAFYNCWNLMNISIPNGVTSIGDLSFAFCQNLYTVSIPDSVTSIGSRILEGTAIYNDESRWENGVLYIGNHLVCAKCDITSCIIKERTLLVAGSAFYGCTVLANIIIPDSVMSIGDGAFAYCYSLNSVTIPDSVTSIGDEAFRYCNSLKSVTIGNGVTSIGDSAFSGCSSLVSITIPDSVTSIGGHAFGGCSSLASVTIPDGMTSIGDYVFYCCGSLESVTIPDSVTSIGDWVFLDCSSLESVNVVADNSCYRSINGVLFNKDKTSVLRYPEGKTDTSYVVPDSVTNIGDYAFYGCSSLESITIPDSVTNIKAYAFEGCSGLESVTIGNSAESIGDYAFYGCSSLESVTIPDSVTSIGDSAFRYCSSLKDVYYNGSQKQWKSISIGSGNKCLTDATIHFTGTSDNPFTDVSEGAAYYDAVMWGNSKGIVSGFTATEFRPNNTCTRAQVVTFLWRAAGSPEPTSTNNPFSDVSAKQANGKDNPFYKAILWGVEKGITSGYPDGTFRPNDTVTRAQFVTFLWRYEGQPTSSTALTFNDTSTIAKGYRDAVAWGVENGVIAGYVNNTFRPNATCTRWQVVLFMYRDMKEN